MKWDRPGQTMGEESEVRSMQSNSHDLRKTNKAKNPAAQDQKQDSGAQNCKHNGAQNKSDANSKY